MCHDRSRIGRFKIHIIIKLVANTVRTLCKDQSTIFLIIMYTVVLCSWSICYK